MRTPDSINYITDNSEEPELFAYMASEKELLTPFPIEQLSKANISNWLKKVNENKCPVRMKIGMHQVSLFLFHQLYPAEIDKLSRHLQKAYN